MKLTKLTLQQHVKDDIFTPATRLNLMDWTGGQVEARANNPIIEVNSAQPELVAENRGSIEELFIILEEENSAGSGVSVRPPEPSC